MVKKDERSPSLPVQTVISDRINISISVPKLNLQFDLNQSANGQTRLLLMLITNKLTPLLTKKQFIKKVRFGDIDLENNQSYPELGITNGSVIIVDIEDEIATNTEDDECTNNVNNIVSKLLQIYKEEGIEKCFSVFIDNYLSNNDYMLILNDLQNSIMINSDNEYSLGKALLFLFDSFCKNHISIEGVKCVIQWISKLLSTCDINCQCMLIPSIINYINIYSSNPIVSSLLQLLLPFFNTSNASIQQSFNSLFFFQTMMKLLQTNNKSSFLQQIFTLLTRWFSWHLSICSELITEEVGNILASVVLSVEWNNTYLKQFIPFISLFARSEESVSVFLKTDLLSALISLFEYHDGMMIVSVIQLFCQFVPYTGFRHLLYLLDIISICKKQIDLYPRNIELAKSIYELLQYLTTEECECIYVVQNQAFSLFYTTVLAFNDNIQILLTSLSTLSHLCELSNFVIDKLASETLFMNIVFLTRDNPFCEELWFSILSLCSLMDRTAIGRKALNNKIIMNELRGCRVLFNENSVVVHQLQQFLNHLSQPLPSQSKKAYLCPLIPFKHDSSIEITGDTSNWYMQYYGQGIDFLSFLLHGLVLSSPHFTPSFFSLIGSLFTSKPLSYLSSIYNLSGVIPCISYLMLHYIGNQEIIQQGIQILSLFSTYPNYLQSFYYDDIISLLIEIVTNYSHIISLLIQALDILILLSQQQSLHARLKKSGIMRMIDCLYEIYNTNQPLDFTLQDISQMNLSQASKQLKDYSQTPSQQIVMKARTLEVNLGLRSVLDESEEAGVEKRWMEKLLLELLHSDRDVQLQLLDLFTILIDSEYHRLIQSFMKNSFGVYSIVKLAIQNLRDKEIVSKSVKLLSVIAIKKNYQKYVDLISVTGLAIRVLKQYHDTVSCVMPSLLLLEHLNSKESLERLNEDCDVFGSLLKDNRNNSEVCEHCFCILRNVCEVSHIFRIQFLQGGILQECCSCLLTHSSRSSLLYNFCGLILVITEESEFENTPSRFDIIDLLLKLLSSSQYSNDCSFLKAMLLALESVVCTSPVLISHFMKKQGLVVLSAFLHEFSNELSIIDVVTSFIFNIVIQINIAKEIISTGVIPRLLHILQTITTQPIQFLSCYCCLRGISCLNIDCVREIQASGGVDILVRGLEMKPYELSVLNEIIWCLYQCTILETTFTEAKRDLILNLLETIQIPSQPEDDFAILFDLLKDALLNMTFDTKETERKQKNELKPLDISTMLKSPLLNIMNSLIRIENVSETDIIINLKRLNTLCSSHIDKTELSHYGTDAVLFTILNQYPDNTKIVSLCFSILLYFISNESPYPLSIQSLQIVMKCLDQSAIQQNFFCVFSILQFLISISLTSLLEFIPSSSFIPILFHACSQALQADSMHSLTSSNILEKHDSKNEVELNDLLHSDILSLQPSELPFSFDQDTESTEDLPNHQVSCFLDYLLTFILELTSSHAFPDFPDFRDLFLQYKNYISESYFLLLKGDVVSRQIAKKPLLQLRLQDNQPDYILIDFSLIDYLLTVISQLSNNEDNILKVCSIIQLLSQVEEYKQEFVEKHGLSLLLTCYKKFNYLTHFVTFSNCLSSLLPDTIDQDIQLSILAICQNVLETSHSNQLIQSVFLLYNRLMSIHVDITVNLPIHLVKQQIELLDTTAEDISIVFTLLSNLLSLYEDPVILESLVVLLFDEVFKGYKYSFLVEKVNELFNRFQDNSILMSLFDKYIPDAYQNALLTAINHQENVESISRLIVAYLFNEQKCQNMIDFGLIEVLHTQLTTILTNEEIGFAVLRIVNQLLQFEEIRETVFRDIELCDSLRKWLIREKPDSEENQQILQSVSSCLINGEFLPKTIYIHTVDPFQYDFGQPPQTAPMIE